MRLIALATLTVLASTLVACEEEVSCTTEAVYSVNVQLEDADGAAIPGATVQYSVDGSAFTDCDEFGDGSYGCGVEQAGTFTIEVDGNGAQDSAEVDVEADVCHVIGETVSFVLAPS